MSIVDFINQPTKHLTNNWSLTLALYPVKHIETGETKVIDISVHDIMEWYEANPQWKRDWSQGCASPANEGEWKSKLANKHSGWKTILDRVKKAPGSKAKDLY